jgi:thiamine-monophosphate kinase
MDLSDGLSSDLAHLCRESGVGAEIEAARIPVDPLIKRAGFDAQALSLALNGGEDFELLFTIRPRAAGKLPAEVEGIPCARIGVVNADAGKVQLVENGRVSRLAPAGFDHFT